MDHLSWREGKVLAWRKSLGVDHAQAPGLEVGSQVGGPGCNTGPASLDGFSKSNRVRQQDQSGAHGVYELPQMEVDALLLGLVHVMHIALLQEPVGREQINLLKRAIDRISVPLGSREALVCCGRR